MRFSSSAKNPFSPSKSNGISGIKQKFVSWLARAVAVAINPDSRPINLIRPIPLMWEWASMWAAATASVAF